MGTTKNLENRALPKMSLWVPMQSGRRMTFSVRRKCFEATPLVGEDWGEGSSSYLQASQAQPGRGQGVHQ